MAFDRSAVHRKLAVIRAKDPDPIVDAQVPIAGLTVPYTKPQLVAWARVRIDFMIELLGMTNAQRNTRLSNIYNGLSTEGKANVAAILANEPFVWDPADPEFDEFVLAALVHIGDPDLRAPD